MVSEIITRVVSLLAISAQVGRCLAPEGQEPPPRRKGRGKGKAKVGAVPSETCRKSALKPEKLWFHGIFMVGFHSKFGISPAKHMDFMRFSGIESYSIYTWLNSETGGCVEVREVGTWRIKDVDFTRKKSLARHKSRFDQPNLGFKSQDWHIMLTWA